MLKNEFLNKKNVKKLFFRWVFNWAHWFVGNAAFIFAIVAIFFAMDYPAVKMPTEVVYVLITYVVIHIGVF